MSDAMVKPSDAIAESVKRRLDQMDALRRVATQSTPPSEIRVRQGRGGMKLKYTDGAYVIRTLNAAFSWDWDFVADSEELLLNNGKPFEVKVRGTLTVRLNGQAVTKTQYGCQPIEMMKNGEAPVSIGDAYKGAATDAMKKCASLLGIALDLYDSDYKAEKYAQSEPDAIPESKPRGGYHETLPERPVRLEGAQPTDAPYLTSAQLGSVGPKTLEILDWLRSMLWDANDLANYIYGEFKLSVDEGDAVKAINALSPSQRNMLHQKIKGKFESRR